MQGPGRYRSISLIGEGGMAQVFLTLAGGLGGTSKLVVVKQLRPELANEEHLRSMFLDEARLALRLNHPNIVQTYEVGESAGSYFIAMEYLEGQAVSDLLLRAGRGQFPLDAHLYVLVELLRGLVYAHELADFDGTPLKMVHRDVSPQNVIVTYEGHVKIVDFGIAKAQNSMSERTQTGVFKGKAKYSSPEQALGEPVDQRADVFSVGVMLFEALSGRRMWGDKTDTAVLVDLANGHRPRVAESVPDAPPELARICERALGQDVGDRYPTSRALLDDLQDYVGAHPAATTATSLGAHVRDLFAVERERLRAAIEEQVRVSDERLAVAFERSASPPSTSSAGASTTPAVATANAVGAAAGQKPSRAWLLGVAVAASAGAVAWTAVHRSQAAQPPAVAARVPAAAAAAPPSAAPSVTTVRLQVRTDPAGASVLFDGAPFVGPAQVGRDTSRHRLSVSAPGFQPHAEDLVLDQDQSLSVALRPVTAPPVTARGTAVAPKVDPKKGAAGSIDEQSPYAR